MSGRQQANVEASAAVAALAKKRQQVFLGVGRQVADGVQEQRAAVRGCHQRAANGRIGAGTDVGAAEQFPGEQRRRHHAAIQRDHPGVAATAVGVQGMGHQFLAGAGFALYQDGGVGGRDRPDPVEEFAHRRTMPDQRRELRRSVRRRRTFGDASQGRCQRPGFKRMRQVIAGTGAHGCHGAADAGLGGYQHHGHGVGDGRQFGGFVERLGSGDDGG